MNSNLGRYSEKCVSTLPLIAVILFLSIPGIDHPAWQAFERELGRATPSPFNACHAG